MLATDYLADKVFAEALTSSLQVAVGIATSGRAAGLGHTLEYLARQTFQPREVYIIYSVQSDIGDLPHRFPSYQFHKGSGGSCEKRNWVIDHAAEADLVFFMDDDFFLHPEHLAVTERAFRLDAGLVASTGRVLADGAKGPGLSAEQAGEALRRAEVREDAPAAPAFNTYGCNMAFRLRSVREHGIHFDEKMPAYAWYEDIDFSRRLARFGAMMQLPAAAGVHLGAKIGRVSGLRLGYSQVANPIYLSRKGSYPWTYALRSLGRNTLANLARSFAPESYVDRRGRLRGNLLAFGDLLRRRLRPDRILHMQ